MSGAHVSDFKIIPVIVSFVLLGFAVLILPFYATAPYFIFALSAGLIFLVFAKEVYLLYAYAIFFWVPVVLSYGPLSIIFKGLKVGEFGIYSIFVLWLAKNFMSSTPRGFVRNFFTVPFLLPLSLFFIGGAIANLFANVPDKDLAFVLFRQNCISGPIAYFLCVKLIKDYREAKMCALALVIGGCLLGWRYFYFFQFRPDLIEFTEDTFRLGGSVSFGSALFSITSLGLAAYLSALLPMAISFYLFSLSKVQRYIGFVSFIILSFFVILTGTRSCWIASALSVLFIIMLSVKKYTKVSYSKIILLCVLLLAGMIAVLNSGLLSESLFRRMEGLKHASEDTSFTARLLMWQYGLKLLLFNPFGLGFCLKYDLGLYANTPHNMYLSIAFTNGIIGLIGFVWFIIGWFKKISKSFKLEFITDKVVYIGAMGGIISFLFSSFFDSYNFFFINTNTMWMILGIATAVSVNNTTASGKNNV